MLLAGDHALGHSALRVALAWTRDIGRLERAADLEEALERAQTADVVVADLEMLRARGLEWSIAALRGAAARPEVIVAAGHAAPEECLVALMAGARSLLLLGTGVREAQATVAAALHDRGLASTLGVRPLLDRHSVMVGSARACDRAFVESLAAAVEAKDPVTSAHLRNVTQLAITVANHVEPALGRDEDFVVGCLLHDVGKIAVPTEILGKEGPLSEQEWDVMRRHPVTGARVVEPIAGSPTVVDVVRHHHERWDGRGYPDGLAGEAIPLAARIFSVCDALEAMTAARPYREAMSAEVALGRVQEASGAQFDPAVVTSLDRGLRDGEIRLERTLELDATAA